MRHYPVSVDEYTKEEAPFIYTKYGEQFAAARPNLEPRTAGTIAFFGHKPLQHGPTAKAWLNAGYIEERK